MKPAPFKFFEVDGWGFMVFVRANANGGPSELIVMTQAAAEPRPRVLRLGVDSAASAGPTLDEFDHDDAAFALTLMLEARS